MSFLKRLFGLNSGNGNDAAAPAVTAETEHNGYTIRATPFAEGGQYQTCGVISKEIDGVMKEHRFIRADRFPSADDAAAHSLRKGKQLVDEQGDAIFR
ncbi:hypothetical protein L598_004600000040 [Mesorhizobium sp. J18]|uniref:HlyU family transcriptional regulator n=1 Tax=Mesorhizobium sp. J18 TaxID=935263 RepID=UPI0011992110|nr:HlyU family transcriptional regulator [Mesorhizobium sp. J18]TWG92750.1 hypothetical protein L598_004800000070 [Mesorhizobium sp. J18]TWG92908.1 hypothetical protein L598_004600000040 [Mesorhizobium sp. J18]